MKISHQTMNILIIQRQNEFVYENENLLNIFQLRGYIFGIAKSKIIPLSFF